MKNEIYCFCRDRGKPKIMRCFPLKALLLFILICPGYFFTQQVIPQSNLNPYSSDKISWQQQFDTIGQLSKLIDPAGRETTITYSEDSSWMTFVTKTNADGNVVKLGYNHRGQLLSMTDGSGTVAFKYDDFGRLIQVQREGEPAVRYNYDLENRITNQTVGDFYAINYTYDFLGRLSSINTPAGTISYDYQTGQGQVIRELPNKVKTLWEFGVNGQLMKTTHIDPNDYILAEYQYQYRPDGLIEAIAEKTQKDQIVKYYEYDNVGRLIRASDDAGKEFRYEYDMLGNRVQTTSTVGVQQQADYDWAGRLTRFNGMECSQDAAGNLNSIIYGDSKMNYQYNEDCQLINSNNKVLYKYDGDGKLIERKVDNEIFSFIANPLSDFWQPMVMDNISEGRTLLIWDGNTPLIIIKNGKPEYVLADHLGSARLIVDEQGKVIQHIDYDPFGTIKNEIDVKGLTPGFSGLFYDPQAKLYLTKARAYNPVLGQFQQIEPLKQIPSGSQKELTLYAYCGNDPVNFVDRNGTWPTWIWGPENMAWQVWYNPSKFDYVGEWTNFYGKGTNWGGKNRSGDVFSRVKDVFGEYPLGDPNILPNSHKDRFYRRHDIQLFVDGHYKKGDIVNVGTPKKPEYFISNGYSDDLFNKPNTKLYLDELGYQHPIMRVVQAFSDYTGLKKLPKGYFESDVKMLDRSNSENWTRVRQNDGNNYSSPLTKIMSIPKYQVTSNRLKRPDDNYIPFFPQPEQPDGYSGQQHPHSGGGSFNKTTPSSVGGVYLGGAGQALDGIGQIEGLSLDANNNLILISKKGDQINMPPLRIDDVVTVFRSVYIHGEGPTVTIDPNPVDPENSAMIIKHDTATEETYVGWILYQADRLMKTYMLGVDNITSKDVISKVAGYEDVLNSIYFNDGISNTSRHEGKWERFWIVPAKVNQFIANGSDLTLFDVPLKLKTQVMKWENGDLVDDSLGKSSLGATRFTEWFTSKYEAIAREQYLKPPAEFGINDSVPVFAELKRIAVITALAEKMRDQGVAMPFWMRDHKVQLVQFEKYTPGMQVTRKRDNIKARIFGGVSLSPETKEVKQYTKIADLKQLTEEERKDGEQKMELANSLSNLVVMGIQQNKPLQNNTIEIENEVFQTIHIPGAESKALSPCKIDEVDMLIPISGGYEIRLSRSFNSFFNPNDSWGQIWTMDLPRLGTVKVPVERTSNKSNYTTAYELFTPLNSMYAKFSHVKEVEHLKTKLQVPDDECGFFGLCNSNPGFLNIPTLELIGKNGEAWHFTENGDLIAMEQNGFRIIYNRNQYGNLMQIVGLLGKKVMAIIDLKYDSNGRLTSATGKNEFLKEQVINYEYDSLGLLAGIRSIQGTLGYHYKNALVSEVTWKDSSPLANHEISLRRFEYVNNGRLDAEYGDNNRKIEYTLSNNKSSTNLKLTIPGDTNFSNYQISYDQAFRPVESSYGDGTQVKWNYAEDGGSSVQIIDAEGNSAHMTETPDKSAITYEITGLPPVTGSFDVSGHLTHMKINDQIIFKQKWSPYGRLLSIESEGSVIQPNYDEDGLQKSILKFPSGSGNKIEKWENVDLDISGRPLKITNFEGFNLEYSYNDQGEIDQMITNRNDKIYGYGFSRNETGQIESIKSSWGNEQYLYDSLGLISKLIINKPGYSKQEQSIMEYDAGRIKKLVQFDGGTIEISYQKDEEKKDLPAQISCQNGLSIGYKYNDVNELMNINIGNVRRIHLEYDASGRVVGYCYQNAR